MKVPRTINLRFWLALSLQKVFHGIKNVHQSPPVRSSMKGMLLGVANDWSCSHVDSLAHKPEATSAEYDRVQDCLTLLCSGD